MKKRLIVLVAGLLLAAAGTLAAGLLPQTGSGMLPAILAHLVLAAVLLTGQSSAATHRNVLYLDGKGGFVQLPTGVCSGVSEATVEAWVKWESFSKWSRVFDFGREGNASMVQNHEKSSTLNFVIRDRGKTRHRI